MLVSFPPHFNTAVQATKTRPECLHHYPHHGAEAALQSFAVKDVFCHDRDFMMARLQKHHQDRHVRMEKQKNPENDETQNTKLVTAVPAQHARQFQIRTTSNKTKTVESGSVKDCIPSIVPKHELLDKTAIYLDPE